MAKHKLITIDDSMAVSLMTNVQVTQAIPAIKIAADRAKSKGAVPVRGGCKPCQAKARNVAVDLMHIKKAAAQLSNQDRIKLKELLNTDKIRLIYRNDSNKLVQLTY